MHYPGEQQLIDFFGVAPADEGDVSIYRVADKSGVSLEFSFDQLNDSVQTSLFYGERMIATVSHERMSGMKIDHDRIFVDCDYNGAKVHLALRIDPFIGIEWSGLRME